jgi:DNA-binding transcriptional LysR family regulator
VAERAESTALDAERAVAAGGEEAAGRVRLTTLEEIAVRLVVPALPSLRERYPRIRVDLLCTAHRVDLARGAADLALRSGRPDEPDLVARRVATLTERPYIARSRLEALGQAASEVADLDGHDVVLLLTPERQTWTDGLGRVTAAIRATSPAATYAAIVAGAGVGLIPDLLAAEDPRLVPLPRLSVVQEHALWLVALPTALQVPRIRAVADHLGEVLAQLG